MALGKSLSLSGLSLSIYRIGRITVSTSYGCPKDRWVHKFKAYRMEAAYIISSEHVSCYPHFIDEETEAQRG